MKTYGFIKLAQAKGIRGSEQQLVMHLVCMWAYTWYNVLFIKNINPKVATFYNHIPDHLKNPKLYTENKSQQIWLLSS